MVLFTLQFRICSKSRCSFREWEGLIVASCTVFPEMLLFKNINRRYLSFHGKIVSAESTTWIVPIISETSFYADRDLHQRAPPDYLYYYTIPMVYDGENAINSQLNS